MAAKTGNSTDVDRRHLLERIEAFDCQLQSAREEVDRAHRLATLGAIAGSIAHEFNNILTPVLSYAQMALGAPDDRDLVQKALRKAVEGSERASQIASAMLGFLQDNESEPVAGVHAVARRALSCLGRDPARDGVRVTVDCDPELAAAIPTVSLQQILMNLIVNAVEAMKPGGGDLTIRARSTSDSNGHSARSTWNTSGPGESRQGPTPLPPSLPASQILLEIVDTGCGMSPDMLHRAFEPLITQPHGKDARRGHGLGLSICKRLTEAAGGRIWVESEPGKGCAVRLLLPVASLQSNGHA